MDASLFVSDQDMLELIHIIVQRIINRHDGSSWVAEYCVHAFGKQCLEDSLRTTDFDAVCRCRYILSGSLFRDFDRVHIISFLRVFVVRCMLKPPIYSSVTQPDAASETVLAYLYKTPFVTFSAGCCHLRRRSAITSSLTSKLMVLLTASMTMTSSSSTKPIRPPSCASGVM